MAEKKTKKLKVETPEVDVFARGNFLSLKLPTSHERAYIAKAKVYGIKGRLDGNGECKVLQTMDVPNGDIALPGDTFDPVEERMTYQRYASLVDRGFIEKDKKTLKKMQGLA